MEHNLKSCSVFGDDRGDPVADRILSALRVVGDQGLSRSAISVGLFRRNLRAERLDVALEDLITAGLVERVETTTEGRNRIDYPFTKETKKTKEVPGLVGGRTLLSLNSFL